MDMVEHDGHCTKLYLKMVTFEFNYKATYYVEWPKLKVFHNCYPVLEDVCDNEKLQFSI